MSDWNAWVISSDERIKHDAQFQFLRPANGFISGKHSAFLVNFVSQVIRNLADLDADGRLDKKEFSIAMFLIKKKLEGLNLPSVLPPGIKSDPQSNFSVANSSGGMTNHAPLTDSGPSHTNGTTSIPLALPAPPTVNASGNPSSKDAHVWSIPSGSRPKYRLLFNQHDRSRCGYVTGMQARSIFIQSGLPQTALAHIWSLADMDKDGNLSFEEFCVAQFLVDKAMANVPLPATLPPSLTVPHQARKSLTSNRKPSQSEEDDEAAKLNISFEAKRLENFRQGQVELDRRKQELSEKLRQEEEIRLENERRERERLEKLRLEKERQQALEAERQAHRLREIEAQREARRQQATEARAKAMHIAEMQRCVEADRQRCEVLRKERILSQEHLEKAIAHRNSLVESHSGQQQRQRELENHLLVATNEVDTHKQAINAMRSKRDSYERELRELTEQTEAAKAELAHWQREREKLSLRVTTGVDTMPTEEQCKTLRTNMEIRRENVEKLKRQLSDLDQRMTLQGQELASRRNTADEVERRADRLADEVQELRRTLLEKIRLDKNRNGILATNFSTDKTLKTLDNVDTEPTEDYEVMFNFVARHPDELSLTLGMVVKVRTINTPITASPGWLYGEVNGSRGLFPESYVRKRVTGKIDPFDPFGVHKVNPVVTNGPKTRTQDSVQPRPPDLPLSSAAPMESANEEPVLFTCIALYPFESTVTGDLNLAVNDTIRVQRIRDEWWEGVCDRTRQSGLFPANYTRKLTPEESQSVQKISATTVAAFDAIDSSSSSSNAPASGLVDWSKSIPVEPAPAKPTLAPTDADSPSSPVNSSPSPSPSVVPTTLPEIARVIAPYKATATGQLSLQPGQLVQLRKRSNKGWWEGELQERGRVRQYGWFPADYVKLISPASAPTSNAVPNATTNAKPSGDVIIPETLPSCTAVITTCDITTTVNSTPVAAKSQLQSAPTDQSDVVVSKAKTNGASSAAVAAAATTTPIAVEPPVVSVERMQAIFSYRAAHADELTFEEGAIITVLGRDEPEWWRGRLHHASGVVAEGLFPMNYVRPYPPTSSTAPVTAVPTTTTTPALFNSAIDGNSGRLKDTVQMRTTAFALENHAAWNVEPGGSVDARDTDERKRVIAELIESERAYGADLAEVKTVFYDPILRSRLIEKTDLDKVFYLWSALMELSDELYQNLLSSSTSNGDLLDINNDNDQSFGIANAILTALPKFDLFQQYCEHQEASTQLLQHLLVTNIHFNDIVHRCEVNTRTKGLPLSGYMLKPMQRLTKYRLLIQRIVDKTPPTNPEYAVFKQARDQFTTLMDGINERMRQKTSARRITWLRDNLISSESDSLPLGLFRETQLLHYGTVYKLKSNRRLIAFLLSEHLLFATSQSGFEFPSSMESTVKMLRLYRQPIPLSDVIVSIGTNLRHVQLGHLYRSLSILPSYTPTSMDSASSNLPHQPSMDDQNATYRFSPVSLNDSSDLPTRLQKSHNSMVSSFSVFARAKPAQPLLSLKVPTLTERDQWIEHIWNAIRKCSKRNSLSILSPLLDMDSKPKTPTMDYILVSVVRLWTENDTEDFTRSVQLELSLDQGPRQQCVVETTSSQSTAHSPVSTLRLWYPTKFSNSTSSVPMVQHLHLWASDQSGELGHCILPLAPLRASANEECSVTKKIRFPGSRIGLHVEFIAQFP